jgi:hypothetical protein
MEWTAIFLPSLSLSLSVKEFYGKVGISDSNVPLSIWGEWDFKFSMLSSPFLVPAQELCLLCRSPERKVRMAESSQIRSRPSPLTHVVQTFTDKNIHFK